MKAPAKDFDPTPGGALTLAEDSDPAPGGPGYIKKIFEIVQIFRKNASPDEKTSIFIFLPNRQRLDIGKKTKTAQRAWMMGSFCKWPVKLKERRTI